MKQLLTNQGRKLLVTIIFLWSSLTMTAQQWALVSGITANDIAVGKNGSVWATGANGVIYRYNGTTWVTMPGGAFRITIDPEGAAWVVNNGGQIFKYSIGTNSWDLKQGTAKDIAIGINGTAWIIGTNPVGGGYGIYQWNGNSWTNIPGGATRIAVDPSGNAWVVNNSNNIFRYTGTYFELIPGLANDIGIGADGTVWCTGTDGQIYKWDGSNWKSHTGAASQIAVAPDGNAWVVNAGGEVLHSIDAATKVQIRTLFPRKQGYEFALLKALNYSAVTSQYFLAGATGNYSNLDDLSKGLGAYALLAAEVLFVKNETITADQIINQVKSDVKTKASINGIISLLLASSISSNQFISSISPESQTALKNWSVNLYRAIKVRLAKSVLNEYNKWKADPCSYKAEGYTRPVDCAMQGMNFANWFASHKPPEDVLTKAGYYGVYSGTATEMATVIALGASALGAITSALSASLALHIQVPDLTILAVRFFVEHMGWGIQALANATTHTILTTISAIAAPVAAAILAIVVGTVQGFQEVEAARVEPMLKMKLGAAITDPINITNVLADSASMKMFLVAFQEAALKGYSVPHLMVDGEVRFYCQAGYMSSFRLSYTLNGQNQVFTTPDLSVGNEKYYTIPYNATNIRVQGWALTGSWKEILNQGLDRPTYICYTSYGTVFEPKYKTDCPEVGSMTTKQNQLTVTQGGGYSAWIRLVYVQNGQTITKIDQSSTASGWRQVFDIPADAKNIRLQAWSNTGVVWEPWKGIIDKSWPVPPNECIKVYGTTLDPKWNNECN